MLSLLVQRMGRIIFERRTSGQQGAVEHVASRVYDLKDPGRKGSAVKGSVCWVLDSFTPGEVERRCGVNGKDAGKREASRVCDEACGTGGLGDPFVQCRRACFCQFLG